MRTLISGLKQDHELIKQGVDQLHENWLKIETKGPSILSLLESQFISLNNFVGGIHHEVEEKLFFPAVDPHSAKIENGPLCSLHMMEHIISPALVTARRRAEDIGFQPICNGERAEKIQAYVKSGTYLAIPLEEHEACHIFSGSLKILFENAKASFESQGITLMILLHNYIEALRSHVRKENDCLFPQCEQVFSTTTKIELPSLAEEIGRRWKIERNNFETRLSGYRVI